MVRHIVTFSLRYRGVVVALACLLFAYGMHTARHAKLDVFPEFAPPRIVVQTEAPGLSAEEVESLVTRPVEYGLNGTPGLRVMYSQSIQGLSVVTCVFGDRADIYRVRQLTGERLSEIASQLPQGVQSPRMGPLTSSTSLTYALGLVAEERTPMELRTFADWTLRLRLLGVPGVARVEVFGGETRELHIAVKPDLLPAHNLALSDVMTAARQATGVRGGGFIENENQRIILRTRGQSLTPAILGEAVVAHRHGVSIRLRDVADVAEGPEPKIGDAQVMGEPGIVMLVHSQFGANTLEVTRGLEAALKEQRPVFAAEKITFHPALFRPANFIEVSLQNIGEALALGGAFVFVVLLLFLANLRSAVIAFVTIPLSLLAAVIVLDHFGASLNTITLGGFAIAIGVVVDDAIIDLENVIRRLRQNRDLAKPRPAFSVVLNATLEVRNPIVYATFIVAAVFLPVLMMSGLNGRLFSPLAIAFILSTLASLLVAMTLTPALCLLLLKNAKAGEPFYIKGLKRLHACCLNGVSRWPKSILLLTLLVCASVATTLPQLGGEFLPEFKEGHYIIRMQMAPGTSTQANLRMGTAITRELLKNPRILTVAQQVGRAEQGEDTMGPEFCEFHVELKRMPGEEEEETLEEIRETLARYPGIAFAATPFLEERIEEILSGGRGEVVIKVFGNDLAGIDRTAREIHQLLGQIPGAAEPFLQAQSGSPELTVNLRHDRSREFGFNPVRLLETIQTAYQGATVAQVYDNDRTLDVKVILEPKMRRDPENIGSLMVRNDSGVTVPLRELADIGRESGRYIVVHENTLRRQQVTCNVDGRDLVSFVAEAKRKIADNIILPPGVTLSYGGAAEAQTRAKEDLLLHSATAAAAIVILLMLVFNSARNTLLVLFNVPFALTGGVLAAWLTGGSLSVGSLVGFVSLFGISARNSILMISHYEQLTAVEGEPWNLATAIRGATERLQPILMTALVVALGLLPIALGAEEAGKEIEGPMAIVILGGLLSSTLLNLLVLPTLALRFGHFKTR